MGENYTYSIFWQPSWAINPEYLVAKIFDSNLEKSKFRSQLHHSFPGDTA